MADLARQGKTILLKKLLSLISPQVISE